LIEVCQNIVGSGFLTHTRSRRYCCCWNHAAGSKPI